MLAGTIRVWIGERPACASNCEQLTTSPQHWQRMPETPLGDVSMTTVPVSSTSPLEVRYSTFSPSCRSPRQALTSAAMIDQSGSQRQMTRHVTRVQSMSELADTISAEDRAKLVVL